MGFGETRSFEVVVGASLLLWLKIHSMNDVAVRFVYVYSMGFPMLRYGFDFGIGFFFSVFM